MASPERFQIPQEKPKEKSAEVRSAEVIPLPVEWHGPGLLEGKLREQGLERLNWLDKKLQENWEDYNLLREGLEVNSNDSLIRKESKTDRRRRHILNLLKRLAKRKDFDEGKNIIIEQLDEQTGQNINKAIDILGFEITKLTDERDFLEERLFDKKTLEEMWKIRKKFFEEAEAKKSSEKREE